MFDPEKLLGKVLGEVLGKGSGKKGKKGSSSLLSGLTSGAGLMTVIGLGVGAYEILRDKQQTGPTAPPPTSPPPPPGQQPNWAAPPPLPTGVDVRPAAAPPTTAPGPGAGPGDAGGELAIRLIQVMIAATHADGTMDEQEEQAVLDKLKGAGLSQEEKMFLLNEMHRPKSIAELTAGITDPATAKTMYMLAASTIAIDSQEERAWLDELAASLGLSKAIQGFLEDQN